MDLTAKQKPEHTNVGTKANPYSSILHLPPRRKLRLLIGLHLFHELLPPELFIKVLWSSEEKDVRLGCYESPTLEKEGTAEQTNNIP